MNCPDRLEDRSASLRAHAGDPLRRCDGRREGEFSVKTQFHTETFVGNASRLCRTGACWRSSLPVAPDFCGLGANAKCPCGGVSLRWSGCRRLV